MRLAYRALLRLLPSDFRSAFSAAMLSDFDRLCEEAGAKNRAAATLATRELLSLLRCIVCEWTAKLTAPPFQRDMIFRDRSRMRPPGASKAFWYGDL